MMAFTELLSMRYIVVALAAALALSACGDDSGGSEEATRFCESLSRLDDAADDSEPATLEEFEEYWSEFQRLATEAAAAAPDEVRNDMELVADAANGSTAEEGLAVLQASDESGFEAVIGDEAADAGPRVMAWADENCTD